jgi:hypothetical protein
MITSKSHSDLDLYPTERLGLGMGVGIGVGVVVGTGASLANWPQPLKSADNPQTIAVLEKPFTKCMPRRFI